MILMSKDTEMRLDVILAHMEKIVSYRREYLDLVAKLQHNGITEITGREVIDINRAMDEVSRKLLLFIYYGR